MNHDSKIISTLWENIDKVNTTHITLMDARFYTVENSPKFNIPEDKNLLWSEPFQGLYLVDVNLARHFKDKCNSVESLLKEAVETGYSVISKNFKVPLKTEYTQASNNIFPRIAIVTLFSSKAKIDVWNRVIREIELPYNTTVDVVLGDNSGIAITENIVKDLTELNKFAKVYSVSLGVPYIAVPDEEYLKPEKHAHVAVIYSKLFNRIIHNYDYLLKIEDDMEPPVDGFNRLYVSMKKLEKDGLRSACVAGYYRQKVAPETPCFSLNKKVWGGAPTIKNVPKELFKVEMQGGGFALYNTEAIKEVLPYRLTFKKINNAYYMSGWDGTIGEAWADSGWSQYCDGTLYCEHHF